MNRKVITQGDELAIHQVFDVSLKMHSTINTIPACNKVRR